MAGNDAAWMKDYRENNPDYVQRQRKLAKARQSALLRLKERHRVDYERLLREEKRRLGIS